MPTELRKTGISVVGDVPWGTHFCHFYETKEDLLDILIPYFKTGLENNEHCIWIVFEPLNENEVRKVLRHAIPEIDEHLKRESIKIISYSDWYLKDGVFNFQQVINQLKVKLSDALSRGYDGMRVSGIESWLTKEDWREFSEYENELNGLLANLKILMLCAYPLNMTKAAKIFDVAHTHQFAIVRRRGKWEIVESPALIYAKEEIKRLNEELEQRVAERTSQLEMINEELRVEIAERKRVEEKLRQSEGQLAEAQQLARVGSWNWDIRNNILTWSDEIYRIFGLQPQEFAATHEAFLRCVHPDDRDFVAEYIESSLKKKTQINYHLRIVQPNGSVRILHSRGNVISDEGGNTIRMYGAVQDVTELIETEKELKNSNEKLRALSASLRSAREEEGTRIAREIHDELGSTLASLKWDLEEMDKILSEQKNLLQISALQKKIEAMLQLTNTIIQTTRRIASELRPSILDDFGLVEAIEWQTQLFQERTGIICNSALEQIELVNEKATAVFRIFQEALTNVLRHSQATKVEINITEAGGELVLTIRDNGKGFTEDARADQLSFGILGMRERAHLIGGKVEITGIKGKGTTVIVRVPIPD